MKDRRGNYCSVKVGDVVIRKNSSNPDLTEGKEYIVRDLDPQDVYIKNDRGRTDKYLKHNFIKKELIPIKIS